MRFLYAATALSMLAILPARAELPASTALLNRTGILYSKRTDKIYVVNERNDTVVVIGRHRPVKEVHVGSAPESLAVNEATGKVYVINSGDRSISVLDGVTDRVVATVQLPGQTYSLAIDPLKNLVYAPGASSMIDGETNTIRPSELGPTDAVLVDATRRQLYLMGYEDNAIAAYNLDTHTFRRLAAGGLHQWGFALLGNTLFVTHVQDASISALNVETAALKEIPTGTMPCALAIDAGASEIYVANYSDGSVTVIHLHDYGQDQTIPIGGRPQAIAVDPGEHLVYIADTLHRTVTVFDPRARRVVDTIKTEEAPYALLVDAPSHTVYAATLGAHGFTVIQPKSNLH